MTSLITITERNGKQAVSARELHCFLESKKDFSSWIKERIERYGFIENQDYCLLTEIGEQKGRGGHNKIEYILTVDAAKELSMVEGNDKGKQARRYFIEAEKRYRQLKQSGGFQIPASFKEALLLAANQQEQIEEQQKQISSMNTEIVEMKKKTDYLEIILSSKETVTTTQIAQDYGMSAKAFNRLLSDFKIQRLVNKQWILYVPYISKGYVHSRTVPITHKDGRKDTIVYTEWRQRGRIFLYEYLKEEGVLALIEKAA